MASNMICSYCGSSNQAGEDFCDMCGAQLNSGQAPGASQVTQAPAPTLLNRRYRVLNALGEGGFGKVYKVEDTQLNNRLLAAKKLDLDSIAPKNHQAAITSFQQEATILGHLQHPHLPRIYEYFVENHDYYLVMDFISGETLNERLQKLPSPVLPVTQVAQIGIQLTSVLDYLHTRQPAIIFRDLKPDNMMITSKDEIYLIDFGIARHFKPGQAGDTIKWGTLEYASPEQVAGRQTSARSDIYSLGAVLYQLLSGDCPTYPPQFAPLKLVGTAQTRLGQLVTRMLERDPQARPASMAEIKKELEVIVQLLQPGAAIPGKQPRKAGNKAPAAPPPAPAPRPKPQKPQVPLPKACGDLLHRYSQHSAAVNALAWSPDGDRLASAGEDRQVQVWQALTGKHLFTYKNHTRTINALAWSPDNQQLASAGNDHSVQIWQARSGQSITHYQGHSHWIQAISWSADGKLLASGDAARQVHLWDARSGRQQHIYYGHKDPVLALTFSPDTRLIASADEGGAVHIWEKASGKLLITYTGHRKAVSSLAWSPDSKLLVSGSWDRTLQIWEAASGKQLTIYTEHERAITAVAWSSAHTTIASASKDQTVRVWNHLTGQTLLTYRSHTASINALSWSPDGSYLASAGGDTTIHVWRAH
ncbi:MAG TPA: WD40 repeat domain-containing serine/threonine-protein kinase [Ktedonobacteraceae bacterium]|nr:WD40 repeat domain-containing serine/threonine-protein kinase [Ktedonobacteraceae bacterium]